jgi:hypothetical protein
MRKYRIEERKFEDGRSEFVPQFSEKSDLDGEHRFFDFFKWSEHKTMIMLKFNSYDECINEIEKDKKREMKPVSIQIHMID